MKSVYLKNCNGRSPVPSELRSPVTCWYRVRPSIECMACPISWKRFSIIPGVNSVGRFLEEWGRFSMRTTTGSW